MVSCFSIFYLTSKILLFLLSPLVWVVLLFLAGILFRRNKRSKFICLTGIIILLLFSNSLFFRWVISTWEKPLQPAESVTTGSEAIVVLGGMASFEDANKRVVFSSSGDRLMQSLDLYSKGKAKRIVISGGSGNLTGGQKPESEFVKEFLIRLGYSDSLVYAENQSINTAQNAEFTAALFNRHKWPKNIILVTSAFHLYRASQCFEKWGFHVVGYGTDPLMPVVPISTSEAIIPNADTLSKWNLLIKEWVGILAYKLMGFI